MSTLLAQWQEGIEHPTAPALLLLQPRDNKSHMQQELAESWGWVWRVFAAATAAALALKPWRCSLWCLL